MPTKQTYKRASSTNPTTNKEMHWPANVDCKGYATEAAWASVNCIRSMAYFLRIYTTTCRCFILSQRFLFSQQKSVGDFDHHLANNFTGWQTKFNFLMSPDQRKRADDDSLNPCYLHQLKLSSRRYTLCVSSVYVTRRLLSSAKTTLNGWGVDVLRSTL